MITRELTRLAAALAVLFVGIAAVTGQSRAPAQPPSSPSVDPLLTEVRELRGEIKQAASASIRAQLFVARLQLQEQRVNGVARQLLDVQNRLAATRQAQAAARERLAATEEGQSRLPVEDRSDDQIRSLRLQIEQGQAREDELRAQESALASTVAGEQARWTEFNQRLDALERSLSTGTPR